MHGKVLILTGFMMFFVGGSAAAAQKDSQAKYLCLSKTARPPVIDGKLGKDEWAGSAKISGFVLKSGICPPKQQAEVFVTYDDKNLYIAARYAESQPDKIKANITRHNGPVYEDDDIEIFIDTNFDRSSCHQFVTNPIGTQWDSLAMKKGAWSTASQVYADCWITEIAIPFTVLKITPEKGLVCGLNVCRMRRSKIPELSCWSPTYGSFHAPGRCGYLVFGSLKDVAARKAGKLRAKLAKVTGKKSAKDALLKEIGELETSAGKAGSFEARFRKLVKSEAAIGEKITALKLSPLCAKLISENQISVNKIKYLISSRLTSPAAMNGYKFPENWRLRKTKGRDYWHDLSYRKMPLYKKAGIADEPFIKDSLLGLYFWSNDQFKRMFFDPKSPTRKLLKKTGRAFCIQANAGRKYPYDIPPSLCRRFLKEFGGQFVGFTGDECYGHECAKKWPRMKLSMPKTRHESFLGFLACFQDRRRPMFHNWALCIDEFRPWTICTNAARLDHYVHDAGTVLMSGHEIGGHQVCNPMAFAFSRGAGRQYDKPWRTYLAVWSTGIVWDSTNGYDVLSPECRNSFGRANWDRGPYSGTSLSLQWREIASALMSGTNMFRDEGDADCGSLYVANYDYRTINTVDNLVKVLRDKPYCISPAGAIRRDLYNIIIKRNDRGATYAPVALVFDRYHGFILGHYLNSVLGVFPYTEADYMMRAVNQTLFPWEHRAGEHRATATGPFGDMFDVLTNNASGEVFDTYGAAMLVGNVEMDGNFVKKLVNYVKNGGTLIVNAKQINGNLSERLQKFLGCKVTEKRGRGKMAFSNLDNSMILEKKPFNFQYLEPTTATPLVSLIKGDKKTAPLVLSNKYGKGRVIVTAPDYLKVPGSKMRMLKLFSHLMRQLNSELLPVKVEGNVEYIVNRNKNGWVVTLINNEGVYKYPGKEEIIKSAENVDAKVTLKRNAAAKVSKVNEWFTGKELKHAETPQGTEVTLTVPAGDVRIVEFE
ncbi:MAG: hypothetical protein K8S55_08250 [Phycisphaerae bacterium]|nr:hypothetical protein [Phycisphaerae bacterium]